MYSAQQSDQAVRTSSMTAPCSSVNVTERYVVTDWNSFVPVDQNMEFNGSSSISCYNVRIPLNQEMNCSIADTRPSFGNEKFPEMVSSFDLSKNCQIGGAISPPNSPLTNNHSFEKNFKGRKRKHMTECVAVHSHSPRIRAEAEQVKDVSPESVKSPIEKDERKQKSELNPGVTTHKQTAKRAKEHPLDGDDPKEDYIHVRAKRGQATNSHSLAERVRREKISERMRLLQDLVPGCNKIAGKAVMLDEIINYVQSLQRQVEFLLMKLAAVSPHPELNSNIEQSLLKDILHAQDGGSAVLGLGPGMSSLHPHLHGPSTRGVMRTEIMSNAPNSEDMLRAAPPHISPVAQISSAWHDELQNVVRMGFVPDAPASGGTEHNGSMKVEL